MLASAFKLLLTLPVELVYATWSYTQSQGGLDVHAGKEFLEHYFVRVRQMLL